MIRNLQIKSVLEPYPASVLLQFVDTLPAPRVDGLKYFNIKSSDGISLSVWGANTEDVLTQFDDFIKLLIFA